MFSTSNVERWLFKIFTTRNQTGPSDKSWQVLLMTGQAQANGQHWPLIIGLQEEIMKRRTCMAADMDRDHITIHKLVAALQGAAM